MNMITFEEIAKHTLPNDIDEVETLLARYVGPEEYRVQLAILHLAEGSPGPIHNFLDQPLIDHQKILDLAERTFPDFPKDAGGHVQ